MLPRAHPRVGGAAPRRNSPSSGGSGVAAIRAPVGKVDRPCVCGPLSFDLKLLRFQLQEKWGKEEIKARDVLSAALYPQVFNDYMKMVR